MPKNILVIEDDANLLKILTETLEKQGYHALAAASGEEAVQLSTRGRPDLILLDLRLPGIDGWETLELLRKTPSVATTPVVVLTACDDVHNRVKGYFADAADYLLKPFRLRELLHRISKALSD